MKYIIHEEELEWADNPNIKGGQMVTFFTKEIQGAQATIGMVKLPKGSESPGKTSGGLIREYKGFIKCFAFPGNTTI